MKPGELVRIKRLGIGVPEGSIGLIMEVSRSEAGFGIYTVNVVGATRMKQIRRLAVHLEVISEGR